MSFIDGENLTRRVEAIASLRKLSLVPGTHYSPGDFVWFPAIRATGAITNTDTTPVRVQHDALRAHYYTSVVGDEAKRAATKQALWDLGFHPEVFRREKSSGRSKGVDIALARDMLAHAFRDNYDVALLIAGDGDYVPLVDELKRLGKIVYVAFPRESGLSNDLRLSCDTFFALDLAIAAAWPTMEASGA